MDREDALNTMGIIFKAENLPPIPSINKNIRYDPFVCIHALHQGSFVRAGNTEVLADTRNPHWKKLVTVLFKFEEKQVFSFRVYYKSASHEISEMSRHVFIGEIVVTLKSLITESAGKLTQPLTKGPAGAVVSPDTTLTIHCENIINFVPCKFKFQFGLYQLTTKPSGQIVIVISRKLADGNWEGVVQTIPKEFQEADNIAWPKMMALLNKLCSGNLFGHIKFGVLQMSESGQYRLIAETSETCLSELLSSRKSQTFKRELSLRPTVDDTATDVAVQSANISIGIMEIKDAVIATSPAHFQDAEELIECQEPAVIAAEEVTVEIIKEEEPDKSKEEVVVVPVVDESATAVIANAFGSVTDVFASATSSFASGFSSFLSAVEESAVIVAISPVKEQQQPEAVVSTTDNSSSSSSASSASSAAAVPEAEERSSIVSQAVSDVSEARSDTRSATGDATGDVIESRGDEVFLTYDYFDEKDTAICENQWRDKLKKRDPPPSTFPNFIAGGCEIGMMIAIDFTKSNDGKSIKSGLHRINEETHAQAMEAVNRLAFRRSSSNPRENQNDETVLNGLNEYQKVILSVGSVIEEYDTDKLYPLMGFGARVPNNDEYKLSHCFPLDPKQPEVQGLDGIMEAYGTCLRTVDKSGPTHFAPCIRHCHQHVLTRQCTQEHQCYHVLVMITDGCINDMEDTIEAIVELAELPVSIIIVGVGETDFTAMDQLDGDVVPLRNKSGVERKRDIVQFVPFKKYLAEGIDALRKEVLAEIPDQLLNYMNLHNIVPNHPPKKDIPN